MARAGEFDVLVVRELDRFARGLAKQLVVEAEFKRAGVSVEYVLDKYPDTPEGSLMKNVRAVIAEYERLKITERMSRGKRLKVQAGNVICNGHAPYGYREEKQNGKVTLVIDEPPAQVVRSIFQWYTIGDEHGQRLSLTRIVHKLNDMHIDTPREGVWKKRRRGEWSRDTVRHFIASQTYIGTWHYGKLGKGNRKNPKEHLLPVAVPAIIDKETWQEAQERLAKNRNQPSSQAKYPYLVGGHVTCAKCGHRMIGSSRVRGKWMNLYYYCPSTRDDGFCVHVCDVPYFHADIVDAAIWEWLKSLLLEPKQLEDGLLEYKEKKDKENEPLCIRLNTIADLLKEKRNRLARLLDLYEVGDLVREELIGREKQIQAEITALAREQANLENTIETRTLTKEQIETIQQFIAEVSEGIDHANSDFAARKRLIDLLGIEVILAIKEGQESAYVSCELWNQKGIVSVGAGNTTGSNSQNNLP